MQAITRIGLVSALGLIQMVATATEPIVTIADIAELRELRQEAVTVIFDGDLPGRQPQRIETITDKHFPGVPIDRLTVTTAGEKSVAYLLHPSQHKGSLAIYHQGHMGDFRLHGQTTIQTLLANGYQVLALAMPRLGMNGHGFSGAEAHEGLPLRVFVEPVVVALNYALEEYSARRVIMLGVSGGAWTTVVAAALDTRIEQSFPVAGGWPGYLRKRAYALRDDWSLAHHEAKRIYRDADTPNFLELYLLGASCGRRQVQIFNSEDPCCFAGNVGIDYEDRIAGLAQAFEGDFRVVVVDNDEHELSVEALNIVLEIASK